jgi:hypothetical protein
MSWAGSPFAVGSSALQQAQILLMPSPSGSGHFPSRGTSLSQYSPFEVSVNLQQTRNPYDARLVCPSSPRRLIGTTQIGTSLFGEFTSLLTWGCAPGFASGQDSGYGGSFLLNFA